MIDDTPEAHKAFDAKGRWSKCPPQCEQCERLRGQGRREAWAIAAEVARMNLRGVVGAEAFLGFMEWAAGDLEGR